MSSMLRRSTTSLAWRAARSSRLPCPHVSTPLLASRPALLACRQACDQQLRWASTAPPGKKEPEKESRWQKYKKLFLEHGPVFVAYYATTYSAGLAVAYGGITVAGIDGVELLRWLQIPEYVPAVNDLSPRLVNGVIAIEINELAEWVRLPLVIATTPALSRAIAQYRHGPPSPPDPKGPAAGAPKGG